MTILAAGPLARLAADLAVVMPLVGMMLFGFRHGLFLATVAGLELFAAFVAAVAAAPALAGWLEGLDFPPDHALVAAAMIVFAGVVVAGRLAVGAAVPDGAMRLAPVIDSVGGAAIGAVAGVVLGAALLVGWSMAEPPESFRLDVGRVRLDVGAPLLRTFARCVEPDAERRERLLDGDPGDGDPDVGGVTGLLERYRLSNWRGRAAMPVPPAIPPGIPP